MDPTPTTPAVPAPRRRPWRSLVFVVLLLTSAAAALLWVARMARSEAGTRWLLDQVPGLTVKGVQGSLLGEALRIESLSWQGSATQPTVLLERIELAQPQWRLLPHAGAWVSLQSPALKAARLIVHSPRESQSSTPPLHLRLPFALRVDALDVQQLQLDDHAPWFDLHAAVMLADADGTEHRIGGLSVRSERLRLTGMARIGTDAPLPLALQLQAAPVAPQGPPWQARVDANGPLAGIGLRANLRSDARDAKAPSLDASARIEPFAAWPLAALQLSTRSLDLSALSNAAPRTRIDGEARIESAGLDRPAQAALRLRNHEPGRWDAGRAPVRELQIDLSGTPNKLDRIDIKQLEVVLADEQGSAGRLLGSGHWAGADLQLQLKAADVEPSRLHRNAGVMKVGGSLTAKVSGVPLPAPRAASATQRSEPWTARIDGVLDGTLAGAGQPVRSELGLVLAVDTIEVTRLSAQAGEATAKATLKARRERDGTQRAWHVVGQGELARFDPLPWWPGAAGSAWAKGPHRASGRWQVDLIVPESWPEPKVGSRTAFVATLRGQAQIELDDSVLAGVPFNGRASATGDGHTLGLTAQLSAANNQASLEGQWAGNAAQDRWRLNAELPAMAALQPAAALFGATGPARWPQAGSVQLQAQVEGRWPAMSGSGTVQASGLRLGEAALQEGHAQWRLGSGDDAALELTLDAKGLNQGTQRIDELQARIDGSLRAHHLSLRIDSPARPPAWSENLLGSTAGGTRIALDGRGAWTPATEGGGRWQASEAALRIGARGNGNVASTGGVPPAAWIDAQGLQGQVSIDAQGTLAQAQLAPGRALLPGGAALRWKEAAWRAEGQRFDLSSELEPLAVAPMLARLQPDIGWGGDLTLAGRVEVHAAERFDADIVLARAAGDLRVADESGTPQSLGIDELRLAFAAHDGVWQFAQGAAGRQFGEMAGAQVVRTQAQARWPGRDAPLDGVLQMRVANLNAWGVWVPPGWRLGGNLQVSAALGGRFGAPELRGQMRGSELSVRNVLQGVGLSDGELEASLEGSIARVQRFSFKGGDGTLQVSGEATLGEAPSAKLHFAAERFRLLGRVDRRLVTSGQADLQLSRETLRLDGRFAIDEGLIDFSRGDAPGLDDDVTVVRAASAPGSNGGPRTAAPLPALMRNAQVNLALDLGEKLQVRGRGLDASLRGDLRLATPGGRATVNGTVRTASGTYVAYAQKMIIERGDLVFTGVPENPRLDIIAVRPNLDVRVGVAVTGQLLSPRVRLFSEPEMTEMDKLSWLVLGRASDGLGRADTALLQRAAVALLAGEQQAPTDQLLGQLGITDFSLRQSDGEVRETIVSLGRQLSQRWYVGYERSVNATTGTWQLIYRIAQRFTLRAQSGMENSLDLIWSWRW